MFEVLNWLYEDIKERMLYQEENEGEIQNVNVG